VQRLAWLSSHSNQVTTSLDFKL